MEEYYNPLYQNDLDFVFYKTTDNGIRVEFIYETSEDGDFIEIHKEVDYEDLYKFVKDLLLDSDRNFDIHNTLIDGFDDYAESYIRENFS